MIRNGTTCLNDPGTLNPDAVGEAAKDTGIRAIITRHTSDLSFGSTEFSQKNKWQASVEACERTIEKWDGAADGRIRAWYCVFTPDTASDDLCHAVRDRAQARNKGIHAHLYVTPKDFRREGFKSPVHRYHELGLLAPNLYLAHLGCIVEEDIALMASHGVKGVTCLSRSMFGSGGYIAHGTDP